MKRGKEEEGGEKVSRTQEGQLELATSGQIDRKFICHLALAGKNSCPTSENIFPITDAPSKIEANARTSALHNAKTQLPQQHSLVHKKRTPINISRNNKQNHHHEAPSYFPLGRIFIGLCTFEHDTSSGNCSLRTFG